MLGQRLSEWGMNPGMWYGHIRAIAGTNGDIIVSDTKSQRQSA
jgi:hypothetical protein